MNQVMTLAEMEAAFDSEWVLVGEPELSQDVQVIRGTVLFHSKSRDEISQADSRLRPRNAAIIYTGSIPEGAAVVL